jgi:hypothetical protein
MEEDGGPSSEGTAAIIRYRLKPKKPEAKAKQKTEPNQQERTNNQSRHTTHDARHNTQHTTHNTRHTTRDATRHQTRHTTHDRRRTAPDTQLGAKKKERHPAKKNQARRVVASVAATEKREQAVAATGVPCCALDSQWVGGGVFGTSCIRGARHCSRPEALRPSISGVHRVAGVGTGLRD